MGTGRAPWGLVGDLRLHSRPMSREGFSSSAPQLSHGKSDCQAPPQGPSSNPAHTAAEPGKAGGWLPLTLSWGARHREALQPHYRKGCVYPELTGRLSSCLPPHRPFCSLPLPAPSSGLPGCPQPLKGLCPFLHPGFAVLSSAQSAAFSPSCTPMLAPLGLLLLQAPTLLPAGAPSDCPPRRSALPQGLCGAVSPPASLHGTRAWRIAGGSRAGKRPQEATLSQGPAYAAGMEPMEVQESGRGLSGHWSLGPRGAGTLSFSRGAALLVFHGTPESWIFKKSHPGVYLLI